MRQLMHSVGESFGESFRDERGSSSMGRKLLVISLALTFVLIFLDSRVSNGWDVPQPAYVLLATIFTGLLAWTAGPRIAQYLNPGAVAGAVARAQKRLKNTDDSRRDDERG
jgi:hypothetical protein